MMIPTSGVVMLPGRVQKEAAEYRHGKSGGKARIRRVKTLLTVLTAFLTNSGRTARAGLRHESRTVGRREKRAQGCGLHPSRRDDRAGDAAGGGCRQRPGHSR